MDGEPLITASFLLEELSSSCEVDVQKPVSNKRKIKLLTVKKEKQKCDDVANSNNSTSCIDINSDNSNDSIDDYFVKSTVLRKNKRATRTPSKTPQKCQKDQSESAQWLTPKRRSNKRTTPDSPDNITLTNAKRRKTGKTSFKDISLPEQIFFSVNKNKFRRKSPSPNQKKKLDIPQGQKHQLKIDDMFGCKFSGIVPEEDELSSVASPQILDVVSDREIRTPTPIKLSLGSPMSCDSETKGHSLEEITSPNCFEQLACHVTSISNNDSPSAIDWRQRYPKDHESDDSILDLQLYVPVKKNEDENNISETVCETTKKTDLPSNSNHEVICIHDSLSLPLGQGNDDILLGDGSLSDVEFNSNCSSPCLSLTLSSPTQSEQEMDVTDVNIGKKKYDVGATRRVSISSAPPSPGITRLSQSPLLGESIDFNDSQQTSQIDICKQLNFSQFSFGVSKYSIDFAEPTLLALPDADLLEQLDSNDGYDSAASAEIDDTFINEQSLLKKAVVAGEVESSNDGGFTEMNSHSDFASPLEDAESPTHEQMIENASQDIGAESNLDNFSHFDRCAHLFNNSSGQAFLNIPISQADAVMKRISEAQPVKRKQIKNKVIGSKDKPHDPEKSDAVKDPRKISSDSIIAIEPSLIIIETQPDPSEREVQDIKDNNVEHTIKETLVISKQKLSVAPNSSSSRKKTNKKTDDESGAPQNIKSKRRSSECTKSTIGKKITSVNATASVTVPHTSKETESTSEKKNLLSKKATTTPRKKKFNPPRSISSLTKSDSKKVDVKPSAPTKGTKVQQKLTMVKPVTRTCCLCQQAIDNKFDEPVGPFDHQQDGSLYFHPDCLQFSTSVTMDRMGNYSGVLEAYNASKTTNCVHCKKMGATIKCAKKICKMIYHYPCAKILTADKEMPLIIDEDNYSIFCEPGHCSDRIE